MKADFQLFFYPYNQSSKPNKLNNMKKCQS
ncbi:hypothetical protein A5875_003300, partial [Enterococcus sp. 3H8_DIV0648]